MDISVVAERPENGKVVADLTIAANDVDAAIAAAYKDIAKKYAFQGFRRGKAPRPVIDNLVGKSAVRAQATETLLNEATPKLIEELNVVPVTNPDFGEEPVLAQDKSDLVVKVTILVPPTAELSNYDPVEIKMPPEEVTDAELDKQIEQLIQYQVTLEDETEERAVVAGDIVVADVVKMDELDGFSMVLGEGRQFDLSSTWLPEAFVEALVGLKVGESKEITWDDVHGDHEHHYGVTATLKTIKKKVYPAFDEELAKKFGFDSIEDFKSAVKEEIATDKEQSLPALKEDRVVEAIGERLVLDELPEAYKEQVFNELAQEVMGDLQRNGMSLDLYLASRNIKVDDFLSDLREQADERARQSLALDALSTKLEFEATDEDVRSEFERAGVQDVDASIKEFIENGRMPAVRESIKRTKAVNWLVENAKVEIVDEIAEAAAEN